MNPKLFIGLFIGILSLPVIYILATVGIHNSWQLFLFCYMIVWVLMAPLIIICKLDLFGFRSMIERKYFAIYNRLKSYREL